MLTCDRKHWTWQDVFRGILAGAFVPRGAEDVIPFRALKLVVVEDSGEPYFCSGKKFTSFDALAKELTGLYSNEHPETALRVSLGDRGEGPGLCEHPIRSYSEMEMMLSVIGKGVDGRPVLRMAFDTPEGSGSGIGE